MAEDEEELQLIYRFLGLENIEDSRLRLKAKLMKRILKYAKQWQQGNYKEWLDKLANRCCLSIRKVRENYVEPLITEGILQLNAEGGIRFVGLPANVEVPPEISEEDLKQELEEENENRLKLGKPPLTLEEWKRIRTPRLKPLAEDTDEI